MLKEILLTETSILQYLYHLRSPLLNTIMIGITHLGGVMMIIFGIIVVIFLLLKKYGSNAFLFTTIVGGSVLLDTILKNIFQRARPQYYPLVIEKDFSFPSGHAMNSLVFYLALSYLYFHISKNKKRSFLMVFSSLILVLLVGISRVYLGVHYPSDIIGGYFFGALWLLCCYTIIHGRTILPFLYKKRRRSYSR